MHKFDPSRKITDYLVFGEFGDVNPSITDSSTFTFLNTEKTVVSQFSLSSESLFAKRSIFIRQIYIRFPIQNHIMDPNIKI